MTVCLKPIKYQTIVITGAISGVGLATARTAAARRAKCVLVARDEAALRDLVDEIRRAGGSAVHVVADMADPEHPRRITQTAVEQFGGYDTWINNAGSSAHGSTLETDPADYRRLFETDFWSVVNGSSEAARHLRERSGRYGGAIINLVSDRALPVQGVYAASKHAIQGFTDAFRREQEAAGAPVSVTLVKPGSLPAPLPERAHDAASQQPTLPPPLYDPEIVARRILNCAERPKRDVYVGGAGRFVAWLGYHAPRLTDLITEANAERAQKTRRRRLVLREPAVGRKQSPRYAPRRFATSLYAKALSRPAAAGGVALGIVLTAAALYRYGLPRPRKTPRRAWKQAEKRLQKQARRVRRRWQ